MSFPTPQSGKLFLIVRRGNSSLDSAFCLGRCSATVAAGLLQTFLQGVLAEAGFQQTLRHAQLFERKNLFVCSLLLLSQDPSSKDAIEVFVRVVIGAAPES